jgi:hypothetical protein
VRRRVKVSVKDGKQFRVVKYRPPSTREKRVYTELANELLADCDRIFSRVSDCDTAVRDLACDGLARLLSVAYDCQGIALGLNDEAFHAFIYSSVGEWLRQRGFSEWYCQGAGSCFNTSRPRIISEVLAGCKKRRRRVSK